MKKLVLFLLIINLCSNLLISHASNNDDNYNLAKTYEGSFYKYLDRGEWYPFSEDGVILGEPEEYIPNDFDIEYYINDEEGYVMQFGIVDDNMGYAIWKDNTLVSISNSKY